MLPYMIPEVSEPEIALGAALLFGILKIGFGAFVGAGLGFVIALLLNNDSAKDGHDRMVTTVVSIIVVAVIGALILPAAWPTS